MLKRIVKLKDSVEKFPIPEGHADNKYAIALSIGKRGEVRLDRDLNGISWWNIADLEDATKEVLEIANAYTRE